MAKGKQNKQPSKSSAPAAGAAGDTPEEAPAATSGGSPYDREPDAGGGALVFLGIIGALLVGAVVVGLLQGQ